MWSEVGWVQNCPPEPFPRSLTEEGGCVLSLPFAFVEGPLRPEVGGKWVE